MQYWSYKKIEALTEQRLDEYKIKTGKPVQPPIPIDNIIEHVFDLNILWEPITENDDEKIWGGLRTDEKQIVINQKHRELFESNPGLLAFTKGHEAAHWDLLENKELIGQPKFDFTEKAKVIYRTSETSSRSIKILAANLGRQDDPMTRRLVDKYSSSLLMPKDLIKSVCAEYDLIRWPNLYKIAEVFNVTISALTIRLQQLKMIYIKGKELFKSEEEGIGQLGLPGMN